jgi:hypothetical protein
MTISRRTALQALGFAAVGAPLSLSAQGRCMLTFGTPACNTTEIAPIFERPAGRRPRSTTSPSGSPTTARGHALIALMGWTLRSDDGKQAVLDMGDWGSAIFRQGDGAARVAVESFSFAIDRWNAKTVEAELRKRGLQPVADNDGKGFESFWVKDPDGWDLQIANGNGLVRSRKAAPAGATLSEPAPPP